MSVHQSPVEKWLEVKLFDPSGDQTFVIMVPEPRPGRSGGKVVWAAAAPLHTMPLSLRPG